MSNPIVITFANFKGGVGKTTLCITMANYLVSKNRSVRVIDCDKQKSIVTKREQECGKMQQEKASIPYKVQFLSLETSTQISEIIRQLRSPEYILLCDLPSNQLNDNIYDIILNSDFIIIPFKYEMMVLSSTAVFLSGILEKMKNRNYRGELGIIFCPNLYEPSVGTKAERELYASIKERLSKFGFVTSNIKKRADMERISTLSDLDRQNEIVTEAFDSIYDLIAKTL